ncbi:hypothetical protein MACK_000925 [Theileria orientalis]|uniref:Uncharacterized protein n=1 Tax=Theileria orientalis TaxID=68886 RepID=A0A976QTL6_THEOR|nr:hypothetical protein MACK_000925 [Theileria orientalis]
MHLTFYFPLVVLFLLNLNGASARNRSRSSGITNTPILLSKSNKQRGTVGLVKLFNSFRSYPYLNVYYNFDSTDWNKIREYNTKLMEMKKRLSRLRHNMTLDMDRIERFLNIQKNLAITSDARGKLFQRALSKNVIQSEPDKKKLEPVRLYDQVTNDLPQEDTYFYQPK